MEIEENIVFSVWIDENNAIVSFEKVEGYKRLDFPSNDEKVKFAVEKGSAGFRIQ